MLFTIQINTLLLFKTTRHKIRTKTTSCFKYLKYQENYEVAKVRNTGARKKKGVSKLKFIREHLLSSLKSVGDSGGETNTGGAESGGVQSSSPPLSGSPC